MKLNKQNIPFTMVANEVLVRTDLSLKAKGMFAYLFSKPQGWDFAADRIASECKEERKTILSILSELESAGLLKRQKQSDGRVDYNIEYADTQSTINGLRVSEPKSQSPLVVLRHGAESGLISNKDLNSNKELEVTQTAYAFEDFYKDFPLHVGKKKASAIYARITEPNRLLIKADIPKRMQSDQWKRGFVPHPTTYLNGERWNDDVVIGSPVKSGSFQSTVHKI